MLKWPYGAQLGGRVRVLLAKTGSAWTRILNAVVQGMILIKSEGLKILKMTFKMTLIC